MNIAIDFDGTCVSNEFPRVGKNIGAENVLNKLVDNGHNLILWTRRSNKKDVKSIDPKIIPIADNYLDHATNWFKEMEIPVYSVYKCPYQHEWTDSPKPNAELFIDDECLGIPLVHNKKVSDKPYVDWIGVENLLDKMGLIEKNIRLCIIGHARHGKDTVAEMLSEKFRIKFMSSSMAAAKIFIYNSIKEKYGYKSLEECFEDRVNHRAEWYDMICDYNKDDKTALAREIMLETDCYVGMRDNRELKECLKKGIFDCVIYVDASKRLPKEDESSFNIDETYADIIINNNGTLEELEAKVTAIGEMILNRNLKPMLEYGSNY